MTQNTDMTTKRSELAFTAALVPIDYLLVLGAALTAHSLRFGWFIALRPATMLIPYEKYVAYSAVAAAVFVLCFALAGLYEVAEPRRIKSEVSRIVLASSTAIMAVILLIFFRGEYFASRFIVLAAWILALVYVALGRIAVRLVQRTLLKHGIGVRRVAVIGGSDRTTTLLVDTLISGSGFHISGVHSSFDAAYAELDAAAAKGDLDEILVTDPAADRETLARILAFAQSRHLGFKYSADLLSTHSRNLDVGALAGIPIVEVRDTRLHGWGRIFKRLFDIIGALALIIVTSPIMLAAAIAIKLDSKGPILFSTLDDGSRVTRMGENGRPFGYFKFRSMRPNSHNQRYTELAHLDTRNEGPLVKIKEDPRITTVGKFLRAYSIDELPEFFLVLMGRMSLVGPRPHLPEEVAKYTDAQRRVLTIKPGITGMAQVSGRADLTFDEEVRLDTYYIENWSPWLDLAILIRTPLVVLARKGAY